MPRCCDSAGEVECRIRGYDRERDRYRYQAVVETSLKHHCP